MVESFRASLTTLMPVNTAVIARPTIEVVENTAFSIVPAVAQALWAAVTTPSPTAYAPLAVVPATIAPVMAI